MAKVAIVTDSNSGIFEEEGKILGVHVIPMPVILEGKTYYHLMDLADGDGDFIGMDLKKRVYLITHDPFEIKLLDKPLREILEKNLKAFANRD